MLWKDAFPKTENTLSWRSRRFGLIVRAFIPVQMEIHSTGAGNLQKNEQRPAGSFPLDSRPNWVRGGLARSGLLECQGEEKRTALGQLGRKLDALDFHSRHWICEGRLVNARVIDSLLSGDPCAPNQSPV